MAASQGRTAVRGAENRLRPQPQRFRVNVPVADEAVLSWMAVQDNHSLSIRLLIRESIERLGYLDVMNKPVDQLPKRGRPVFQDEITEATASAPATQHQASLVVEHPLPDRAPAGAVSSDLDLSEDPVGEPELLGIALQAPSLVQNPAPPTVAPLVSIPAPSKPEQSSSGQMEVNDIFSTLR